MARTVEQAEAWGRANPQRDSGSWKNWCASLMFRAGGFDWSADTATEARQASSITSFDASLAPTGSFHWWDISGITAGHVGMDLVGGGRRIMMATNQLDESWGTAIGTSSVGSYGTHTNATYRGWSHDYVGQHLADSSSHAGDEGIILQQLARHYGYTGPIDGVPGTLTWAALQSALRGFGYGGPVDGVPGINTYRALQTLARQGGYIGPLDSQLGPRTLSALQNIAHS
ncbi:peptidoglycan-binding domain-containing protein [Cryobacterium sp. Sr3]|uniref:peptidoglycan-binding domain-containing protein n=1 Tax=Cryobacterium sp. Sr3 TaxID=1259194 RepID=UPI00106DD253|nr:peptidoglycan-binding domain-containing protein [Cryobacterium sp. Sr3]TFB59625.1 peptidoglycan-binding protein [Cryobacterium sp. Sr3]